MEDTYIFSLIFSTYWFACLHLVLFLKQNIQVNLQLCINKYIIEIALPDVILTFKKQKFCA